jgi:hypothetical protein
LAWAPGRAITSHGSPAFDLDPGDERLEEALLGVHHAELVLVLAALRTGSGKTVARAASRGS